MDALIMKPWQRTDRQSRDHDMRIRELDRVIDGLAQRQKALSHRIAREAGHARIRRLTLALAVARLQYKKALALREQLVG